MICEYGCGREAKFPPTKGMKKWCCREHFNKCPARIEHLKKIATLKRKPLNDSHKKTLSEKQKINWKNPKSEFNKQTYRSKISKTSRERWKDSEYRKNQSISRRGLKRSDEFKKDQSIRIIGHEGYNKKTLEKLSKKYPLFISVEEIREHPTTKKIQVHCKNHNCKNSKEKGGWFEPTNDQLYGRIGSIENPIGFEELNFYCSDECKQSCRLYNKKPSQLIKEDQIKTGIVQESIYSSEEYNTWRQEVLNRADYICEYCGELAEHCHHIKPQKLEPFFSLDPDYGVACCKKCHYEKGHRDECSTGQLAQFVCNDIKVKN